MGGGGHRHQPLEAIGGLGMKPLELSEFFNFSMKLAHFYAYFDQHSNSKAITHHLKAFEKQSKRTK